MRKAPCNNKTLIKTAETPQQQLLWGLAYSKTNFYLKETIVIKGEKHNVL